MHSKTWFWCISHRFPEPFDAHPTASNVLSACTQSKTNLHWIELEEVEYIKILQDTLKYVSKHACTLKYGGRRKSKQKNAKKHERTSQYFWRLTIMFFPEYGLFLGGQQSWQMMTFSQDENVDFLLHLTANLSIWGVLKWLQIASNKMKKYMKIQTWKTTESVRNLEAESALSGGPSGMRQGSVFEEFGRVWKENLEHALHPCGRRRI